MPSANPCDRKPTRKTRLPGGVTVHTYLKVPVNEAAPLILCRRKDPDYWNDDVTAGNDKKSCTVQVYYKKK